MNSQSTARRAPGSPPVSDAPRPHEGEDVVTVRGLVKRYGDLVDRADAPVKTFSGGMKRRLEVARGILHAPEVLFLDEPTQGLDPQTRARVWDHLRVVRARTRTTIFMTTHYLEEAEWCDRIAIIDHGRIVALGTPEEPWWSSRRRWVRAARRSCPPERAGRCHRAQPGPGTTCAARSPRSPVCLFWSSWV